MVIASPSERDVKGSLPANGSPPLAAFEAVFPGGGPRYTLRRNNASAIKI